MKNYSAFASLMLLSITVYFTGCNFNTGDQENKTDSDATLVSDSLEVTALLRNT